jgi:hypothetical protein
MHVSALPTRIEVQAGRPLTPDEIFNITASRENKLSRLLMLYVTTGLVFMLLPGTFLGVWNLIAISVRREASSVSPAWIQAHGHAQIFGWIGSFILGIGFYSIPKLRRATPFALSFAWTCWGVWTAGVGLRWFTGVYDWHWRVLLPVSAILELAAFLIFFRIVSRHSPQDSGKSKFEHWVIVVIAASSGLLLTLLVNLGAAFYLAIYCSSASLPAEFDQRLLILETWGFLVPFVWGFSAKWMPIFLGLRSPRGRALLAAVAMNATGVLAALAGLMTPAVILLAAGIAIATYALRFFEAREKPAKLKGVHSSLPLFIRVAYVWGIIAAFLAIWASRVPDSRGIWGASRHALTVGFLATMVFCVGQRVLPAFSGMHLLFSTKLMFIGLLLLTIGCFLRVGSEILAYQGFAHWAWSWLPISAITELTAVTVFATNLFRTFSSRPPAPVCKIP